MELNKHGFLAAVMALSVSACGGDAEVETADNTDTTGDEVVVQEEVTVVEEEPYEPEPEPMIEEEPDLGPTPE